MRKKKEYENKLDTQKKKYEAIMANRMDAQNEEYESKLTDIA